MRSVTVEREGVRRDDLEQVEMIGGQDRLVDLSGGQPLTDQLHGIPDGDGGDQLDLLGEDLPLDQSIRFQQTRVHG